jgi:hypothetical protein
MTSYNDSNHRFSPIWWGGQDPNGVTTGGQQAAAGRGDRLSRRQRGELVQGMGPLPLPVVESPLNLDFVREIQASQRPRTSTAKAALEGGVLGSGLVLAWRYARNHR